MKRTTFNRCRCSHSREAHDKDTGRCHFCRCQKFDNKAEPLEEPKQAKPRWHDDQRPE